MLKTIEFYLIKLFIKKIINVSLIFLCLLFILSVFGEITFFNNDRV